MMKSILLILIVFNLSFCFDYKNRGDDWTGICANGTSQSPIDFNFSNSKLWSPFYFFQSLKDNNIMTYTDMDWNIRLQGMSGYIYTIEAYTITNGLRFSINYVDFHSPSEHQINGQTYDLEMQIYLSLVSGTAVPPMTDGAISFLFNSNFNIENSFLRQIVTNPPVNNNTQVNISFSSLFSKDMVLYNSFFGYRGSYTTPPCIQNVNWYVIGTPLNMSKTQLSFFSNKWKNNNTFANGNGNNRRTKKQFDTIFKYP